MGVSLVFQRLDHVLSSVFGSAGLPENLGHSLIALQLCFAAVAIGEDRLQLAANIPNVHFIGHEFGHNLFAAHQIDQRDERNFQEEAAQQAE